MAEPKPRPPAETRAEHEARLQPILDQLEAQGHSVFLDLCQLVLMLARKVDGSIKWDHWRCTVHIRQRQAALRNAKRRGIELDENEPEV